MSFQSYVWKLPYTWFRNILCDRNKNYIKNIQIVSEQFNSRKISLLNEWCWDSWIPTCKRMKLDSLQPTHTPHIIIKESEVAQTCPTLCDPMDCSLPGFSVQGIFQARVLEWVAISFSRGSSWPRDRPRVSHIVGRSFYPLSHQRSHHNKNELKMDQRPNVRVKTTGNPWTAWGLVCQPSPQSKTHKSLQTPPYLWFHNREFNEPQVM